MSSISGQFRLSCPQIRWDVDQRRRGMTLLPHTLLKALNALEDDEVVMFALGPSPMNSSG